MLSQHFCIRNFKIAGKLFKHETKTYINICNIYYIYIYISDMNIFKSLPTIILTTCFSIHCYALAIYGKIA